MGPGMETRLRRGVYPELLRHGYRAHASKLGDPEVGCSVHGFLFSLSNIPPMPSAVRAPRPAYVA
jgi:hypothetical protein